MAEVQWDGSVVDAMESTEFENANLGVKINTRRARQRYLEHLAEDGSRAHDDDAVCILCQCEFLRGFVTQWYVASPSRGMYTDILNSAHIFCEVRCAHLHLLTVSVNRHYPKGCMKAWIARGQGRACPVCRYAPLNHFESLTECICIFQVSYRSQSAATLHDSRRSTAPTEALVAQRRTSPNFPSGNPVQRNW